MPNRGTVQRQDWLLLFLAAPARSGESPRSIEPLRIMKGLFLVSQRGAGPLRDVYTFKPYDYGPFTPEIYSDLEVLVAKGLVARDAVSGRSWRVYRPTLDGLERADDLLAQIDPKEQQMIDDAYSFVSTRGFLKLLRDIYAEYPAYAVNSVVQDAAPKS
jgi:uncharacterized protein